MKKDFKTYFAITISCLTIVIVAYLYFSNNRYYISDAGNDLAYKIDTWTGDTWLLIENEEIKIKEQNGSNQSENSKSVIELVQSGYDLPNTNARLHLDNEYAIRSILRDLDGDLIINGWTNEKLSDQTYLVSYEYLHNGEKISHVFEVNTKESIVRYVNRSSILLKKYSDYVHGYSSLHLLYDNLINNNKITGLPDFQSFKEKLINDVVARKEFHQRIAELNESIPSDFDTFNELYFESE